MQWCCIKYLVGCTSVFLSSTLPQRYLHRAAKITEHIKHVAAERYLGTHLTLTLLIFKYLFSNRKGRCCFPVHPIQLYSDVTFSSKKFNDSPILNFVTFEIVLND